MEETEALMKKGFGALERRRTRRKQSVDSRNSVLWAWNQKIERAELGESLFSFLFVPQQSFDIVRRATIGRSVGMGQAGYLTERVRTSAMIRRRHEVRNKE